MKRLTAQRRLEAAHDVLRHLGWARTAQSGSEERYPKVPNADGFRLDFLWLRGLRLLANRGNRSTFVEAVFAMVWPDLLGFRVHPFVVERGQAQPSTRRSAERVRVI